MRNKVKSQCRCGVLALSAILYQSCDCLANASGAGNKRFVLDMYLRVLLKRGHPAPESTRLFAELNRLFKLLTQFRMFKHDF